MIVARMYSHPFLLGAISPSDYARHSTRSRKVTNYNEDNAWGISDEEAIDPYNPAPGDGGRSSAPPVEEDEGEVIESVLDHRRKGKN
jgi:chromodomain-helicase-DNA-binding protein 1